METSKKKRIVILAHYYFPDAASTGQLLQEQAEGMLKEFDVTVICVVPSYTGKIEDKYKTKKYYYENINGVSVIRVRVPEFSKNVKSSRIKNIISYFWGVIGALGKVGKQDYVFTISQPPILGGVLGVLAKWNKKAKLIYCIQDFNPEQIKAVNYISNKFIVNVIPKIDKFSCKKSDLVITVGRDLVDTLVKRFNGRNVPNHIMINNWIDEHAIYPLSMDDTNVKGFKQKHGLENKYIIMYSGNIGLYYDLENILKVIDDIGNNQVTPSGKEVAFVFVGDGSVKKQMVTYAHEHAMTNVYFVPYQDKEDLIYSLNAADVHWCVNAKGIKGVSCPSKYYGIAACAKPVLAVLESGSEIRRIIEDNNCGLVCDPEDYAQIRENILWFIANENNDEIRQMSNRGYVFLKANLTKEISIRKYIEAIKTL